MRRIALSTFGPWAIITGASSGIGEEFARQLAASGLHLVLVARRLKALNTLGSELTRAFGISYRAIELDLTTDDALEKLSEATRDLNVGLVISNAGTMTPGDFLSLDYQALRRDLRLNVQAHLDLAYHFGSHLAQRGRGGLLLVASTTGFQGVPFAAEYAAAKAYVLSLGEALHVEFQRMGVHVTVLSPGATDTPLIATSGFDASTMPMKPMATRQCVSEGLAALAANRAVHIPGYFNRMLTTLLPRSLATSMYGSMMRQIVARRSVPSKGNRRGWRGIFSPL